jgi:rsbT co-antagonist protein RsbR
LEAERPALVASLTQEILAFAPNYATMLADPPAQRIDANVGVYLDALDDPDQIEVWTRQQLGPAITQNLDLDQAIDLTAMYRQHFLSLSLRALAEGVAGAATGLLHLAELVDRRARVLSQYYRDRLHMFEVLVENSLDSIIVTDSVGNVEFCNRAAAQLRGMADRSELIGKQAISFLVPEEVERMQRDVAPQLRATGMWRDQFWCMRPNGERYRIQSSIIPLTDNQGKQLGLATFARDITADYLAEQELRQQADQLRTAADRLEQSFVSTPLATIEWDAAGNITRWNPSAERIFGWKAAEALGKNAIALVAPYISPDEIQQILDLHMRGEIVNSRFRNITKDGREITCQWYNALLRDRAGNVVAVLAQAEDLSEHMRAEQERAALQEQVIEAQQAALRELSTPLIPLADGVVAMPLIGSVDSARAQQVIEELLSGVAGNRATTAIIDITGVPVVDTQVAGAFLRAAQAVELLGARVILTGIRPEVAQTLVGIGVNLGNIVTRSTLQDGISFALAARGSF